MIALLQQAVDVGLMKPCEVAGCPGLVWIGKGTLCPDHREEVEKPIEKKEAA